MHFDSSSRNNSIKYRRIQKLYSIGSVFTQMHTRWIQFSWHTCRTDIIAVKKKVVSFSFFRLFWIQKFEIFIKVLQILSKPTLTHAWKIRSLHTKWTFSSHKCWSARSYSIQAHQITYKFRTESSRLGSCPDDCNMRDGLSFNIWPTSNLS